MTMQCIRCQAEDTEPARFCRQCGYPYVFGELIHCPVCGGEVRQENKVCPGCHHVFAVPVALAPAPVPLQRRSQRYVVPVIAVFVLAGLAFFYAIADREVVQARPAAYAKLDPAATPPVNETEPGPQAPIAPLHATVEPASEIVPAKEEPKAVRAEVGPAALKQERQETKQPGTKPQVANAKKETVKADTSVPPPSSIAKSVTPPPQIYPRVEAAGPVQVRADAPLANGQPVMQPPLEKPKVGEAQEVRETKEVKTVAAPDRARASTRGAPVVERSRNAEPAQISRLPRERDRRRCDGRWEGECRQFPDHKPNW